jgi:hypothetical protein
MCFVVGIRYEEDTRGSLRYEDEMRGSMRHGDEMRGSMRYGDDMRGSMRHGEEALVRGSHRHIDHDADRFTTPMVRVIRDGWEIERPTSPQHHREVLLRNSSFRASGMRDGDDISSIRRSGQRYANEDDRGVEKYMQSSGKDWDEAPRSSMRNSGDTVPLARSSVVKPKLNESPHDDRVPFGMITNERVADISESLSVRSSVQGESVDSGQPANGGGVMEDRALNVDPRTPQPHESLTRSVDPRKSLDIRTMDRASLDIRTRTGNETSLRVVVVDGDEDEEDAIRASTSQVGTFGHKK